MLYFVLADPVARRASREFLELARGQPALWGDVFRHFYAFASTLLDRVYLAAGEFDRFAVTIEGASLVEEELQAGKGCLLLGSHLGSFDFMMLAHRAMNGPPLSVMMRVDPRARLRRIAGIDDDSVRLIPLGRPDSFLTAYEALREGEMVAILADRVEGSSSRFVEFFGRKASMPIAPHVLAARSGAPVFMCFGLYEGRNRYHLKFVEFGPAAPIGSRGSDLQPMVDRYAALLEQHARRYPLNWFNFFPYWHRSGTSS